jgi:hypothetical protein
MCRASQVSAPGTPWGTQNVPIHLKANYFDGASLLTGDPALEIRDGKLVGARFDNAPAPVEKLLDLLSRKFGEPEIKSGTYLWIRPDVSVRMDVERRTRYSPDGQVDSRHPLGDGIVSESYDSGSFTIYTPAARASVNAYEAQQTPSERKPGV